MVFLCVCFYSVLCFFSSFLCMYCICCISCILNEKSAQRSASCSKAEPNFFRSAADPLHGGVGQPKFNQLEMVTIFTYKPSLVRIDARNFELS